MNKFRRFACFFIVIEIVVFAAINLWAIGNSTNDNGKLHRVDISRISSRIESGENISQIDFGEYETIVAVEVFDSNKYYKNEYEVREINDELYCFEYVENYYRTIFVFDACMVAIIVANIILLIYLDRKMLSPFTRMNHLTEELAKGNLAVPIKQEKSKFFGRFLWGMDMLREKLEADKTRELDLIKEKKILILSLSHDIKTPLSAIDLYAKALKRNLYNTEEEREAVFEGIEKNVSEIKGYLNEIIEASREDFIALEAHCGEVYLSEVIKSITTYYVEKMKSLRVSFTVDDMEDCLVYGDLERIIEVLQNIIENALKYGDGKDIHISLNEEEDCKLLTVSNSGCELVKDEMTHIFDSFYRGSNVKNQNGSGLGLYICKELMHKMDGDIFANINNNNFEITIVLQKI